MNCGRTRTRIWICQTGSKRQDAGFAFFGLRFSAGGQPQSDPPSRISTLRQPVLHRATASQGMEIGFGGERLK